MGWVAVTGPTTQYPRGRGQRESHAPAWLFRFGTPEECIRAKTETYVRQFTNVSLDQRNYPHKRRANVKSGKPPMFHPALSSSATDGIVTWAKIDIGRGAKG